MAERMDSICFLIDDDCSGSRYGPQLMEPSIDQQSKCLRQLLCLRSERIRGIELHYTESMINDPNHSFPNFGGLFHHVWIDPVCVQCPFVYVLQVSYGP
jgi:hypothetical protein